MNIVGIAMIEAHYEREVRQLELLYEIKANRLVKAEKANDHGLIIILHNEVEAIKCTLAAGYLLKNCYIEHLHQVVNKLKAAREEIRVLKSAIRTVLHDQEPISVEEIQNMELCQQ